jgi:hypothetical protein
MVKLGLIHYIYVTMIFIYITNNVIKKRRCTSLYSCYWNNRICILRKLIKGCSNYI